MFAWSYQNISLVSWELRAFIAVLAGAALVSSVFVFRRPLLRWSLRGLVVVLLVGFVAAAIDAHYYYFPTVGTLLGRYAADQVALSDLGHMRRPAAVQPRRHGAVVSMDIPGALSGFSARPAHVYLPPAWFIDHHAPLPVIELLHGTPGAPADWTRGGSADVTADKYAAGHNGYAPILVMPDVNGGWWSDSECVNGPRGNVDTYLTADVRAAIVRRFGVSPARSSWAVAGLSEGGTCALTMGLRHPNWFAAVGDYGGDNHPWVNGGLHSLFFGRNEWQLVQAENSYDPRYLLRHAWQSQRPAIAFTAGLSDHRAIEQIMPLAGRARDDHLPDMVALLPGGHTFRFWARSFQATLPWLVEQLAAANHTERSAQVASRCGTTYAAAAVSRMASAMRSCPAALGWSPSAASK